MIPVSSAQVWLTRELADHIRSVLEPLVEAARRDAYAVGGNPDDQVKKAHHVGRAEGLLNAINALTSSPTDAPSREAGLVTADAVRRMKRNRGAHRGTP